MTSLRVVILGSGRGSNAEAILRAQQAGELGCARVAAILSDRPDARMGFLLELMEGFPKSVDP
jgi:folate-dependent phosphoribosylglycinamide formyltransferase PurN